MKSLLLVCGALLLCGRALGTEEAILNPHRVHLSVDAGEPFGEAEAIVESSGKGEDCRVQSMSLTVGGKTYSVPRSQLQDLRDPLLRTVQLRRAGEGKDAYLNLTLKLWVRKSAAEFPEACVVFHGGKLKKLYVMTIEGDVIKIKP